MLFWKRIKQLENIIKENQYELQAHSNAIKTMFSIIEDLKAEIEKKSQTEVIKPVEQDPWEKYKNKDGLYDFRNYQEKTIEREDENE
jgi:hypothetical protein